jgi:hypothetical protein
MRTLVEPPPFFLTETLVDETCISHCGGPDSPAEPSPETSRHGVLSNVSVPLTTVVVITLDEDETVLLYGTFGRVGCLFSTVTSPDPDTSTFKPSLALLLFFTENVVTHDVPAVTVRPRQLKLTIGSSELAI